MCVPKLELGNEINEIKSRSLGTRKNGDGARRAPYRADSYYIEKL